MKQISPAITSLCIRKLLDDARNIFAKYCGYERWGDIKAQPEIDSVRSTMTEVLDKDQDMVDLVIGHNPLRSAGNKAAHKYTPSQIRTAIRTYAFKP